MTVIYPLKDRADIRAILAPNPSSFTAGGTWTYLYGRGEVTLIDPGPAIPAHLATLLASLDPGERIARILLTHSHVDHSGLVPALKAATGAPVMAFAASRGALSSAMAALPAAIAGGEGIDRDFRPDVLLAEGDEVAGLRVLHIPGHMSNHVAYVGTGFAFSGDHVLSYASTFFSPPDGEVAAFRASCAKLLALGQVRLLPGHGEVIEDAKGRITWLLDHRNTREREVLAALAGAPKTAEAIVAALYTDLPRPARRPAERNVIAHLVDLWQRGLVTPLGGVSADATWQLASQR